jgi:hypothetical protein
MTTKTTWRVVLRNEHGDEIAGETGFPDVHAGYLRGIDLLLKTGMFAEGARRFRADIFAGERLRVSIDLEAED